MKYYSYSEKNYRALIKYDFFPSNGAHTENDDEKRHTENICIHIK